MYFLRYAFEGFGIYIDDASFSRYRRVVQRLAQQGKLAVVFSDESLVSVFVVVALFVGRSAPPAAPESSFRQNVAAFVQLL